ncbi:hypothetical protein ABPG75_001244 [Micractinium tetrahymenae]
MEVAQPAARPGKTGAHLLKHTVTPEIAAAAAAAFGADQLEAGKAILELRQPGLRQVFQEVYSVTTGSGNNEWMRSKLLQAVGLGPRWRPPSAEPQQEEPVRQRVRRPPAALLQAGLDSEDSHSGEQSARSGQGQKSQRSLGSGGERPSKCARAQGATSAASPSAPPPPMVVVLVADPKGQLPAWPGFMQLPATMAAGGLPFVQTADGGWQLPAGHALVQQVQQAQQAQHHAWQTQQAQQQAWEAQQAQQQAQEMRRQASPAVPLAVEDILLPQLAGSENGAQQAVWDALQAAGFMPAPAAAQPAAFPAQLAPAAAVPPASRPWTVTTGAMQPVPCEQAPQQPAQQQHHQQQQQAESQAQAHALLTQQAQQPAARFEAELSMSGGSSAALRRAGPAAPSPFAAEAAVPMPPEEQRPPAPMPPPASQQQQRHEQAKHAQGEAQPSLLPGDFSLLGLSAMGLDGLCGASLASLQTASADLHRLFAAWQQGQVSLSLSRPDLPPPLPAAVGL